MRAEPEAQAPSAIHVQTMGTPQAAAQSYKAPPRPDMQALLAPVAPREAAIRIDRIALTVQAPATPLPKAAPVQATQAAAPRAAAPAAAYRNPWASYHARRD